MKSIKQLTEDIEKLEKIILTFGKRLQDLQNKLDDETNSRLELRRMFHNHACAQIEEGAHKF